VTIEGSVRQFKIVENSEGSIWLKNKECINLEKSNNIWRQRPATIDTIIRCTANGYFGNGKWFVKAVGQAGSTETTNSFWVVTIRLIDYNLK
jgi:hypothetical protein